MFLMLGGGGLLWAQSQEILLDHDPQFFYPQRTSPKLRTPVLFPHESHLEVFECLECHHEFENGVNVLDEDELEEDNPDLLCSSCHRAGHAVGLEDAFHRQCVGCHDRLKSRYWISGRGIQWKTLLRPSGSGPRLCGQCHPRQPPIKMLWE